MFSLFTAYAIVCVENKIYVGFGLCHQQNWKSWVCTKRHSMSSVWKPCETWITKLGLTKKMNPKYLVRVLPPVFSFTLYHKNINVTLKAAPMIVKDHNLTKIKKT